MKTKNKAYLKGIVLAAMPSFLFSCLTDPADVKELTKEDRQPMELQENIHMVYTDSAVKKMELEAVKAANYSQLEEPYLEFPEGIFVRFFDRYGEEDSRLRSDYAIRYPEEHYWEAKGNVVVNNRQGEKLETEHLLWDEEKEKIFSEDFVKMSTDNEVITGEGFEADQNFTKWRISKVTGEIQLDEEQSDEDSSKSN